MKKIWGLDIFRGLAAMLVFFFHYWTFYGMPNVESFFGKIFSAGHLGVDIFFVLSGFLVSLSLFRYCSVESQSGRPQGCAPTNSNALKKYFSARLRRIVPLAVASTLLFFIIKRNFGTENFLDLFAHILFLQGFFQNFYHSINPVMWTLSVEMLFYIFLPLLYVFIAKKNFTRFLSIGFFLVVLSFIWRGVVFYWYPESSAQEKIFLSEQLWGRFDQFFLGMVLAVLVFTKKVSRHSKKFWNDGFQYYFSILSGILIFSFSYSTFAEIGSGFRDVFWMQVLLHSLVGLGFFLFLLGFVGLQNTSDKKHRDLNRTPLQKIFTPLLFLGEISYGIYVFHFPIVSQVSKIFPNPLIGFIVSFIFTILLSWISWQFFEKKFLVKK